MIRSWKAKRWRAIAGRSAALMMSHAWPARMDISSASTQNIASGLAPLAFSFPLPSLPIAHAQCNNIFARVCRQQKPLVTCSPTSTMQSQATFSLARTLAHPQLCTRQLPSTGIFRARTNPPVAHLRSSFSTASRLRIETYADKSYTQPSENLNQDVTKAEEEHFEKQVADNKAKQIRTPWHREGSDTPPVARQRSASAMTKGV